MTRILTLAALSAGLIASAANAQQQVKALSTDSAAKSGVSDSLFALSASDGGLAEVMLAEMGAEKATDPELKKFSQQMLAEHNKLNSELMGVATQKRMTLPRAVSAGHEFCAQSLAGLSGEEFDRCYAKAQLTLHMSSLAAFEAEAERGQDPAFKALAAKALPHIKMHLKEIRPIAMKYEKEKPETGR